MELVSEPHFCILECLSTRVLEFSIPRHFFRSIRHYFNEGVIMEIRSKSRTY
jgi:hypothetical protein